MAKIETRAALNVGVEIVIDEPNRTIELVATGNLVAKDGVSTVTILNKLADLWATATYQDSPFPGNTLDGRSGQFEVGVDAAANANGWKWLNDTTRSYLRDGGCTEYNATGGIGRIYAGIGGLGIVSSGAQLYYQDTVGGTPKDFTYDDQANEMIQVFGNSIEDPTTTDFDNRAYFKVFAREQGKLYASSVLSDTGETETGPYSVSFLIGNSDDLKISASDSTIENDAPYTGITVTFYATDQARIIGGIVRQFRIIVEGNGATLEQIYEKIQYLLRQNSDIDSGSGTVTGKTAASLLSFATGPLITSFGVYVDNIQNVDSDRIGFTDRSNIVRTNPFESAGILSFNPVMVGAGSSYRLMYTNLAGTDNDYGSSKAVTVLDASGNIIEGVITSGEIAFTFDHENDNIGGAAGTDKAVTLIGIRPSGSKFAVAHGFLTRSKLISLSLTAEQNRAYK